MTALLVWLVCLVCAALWYVLTASAAALTAAAALVLAALSGVILALAARRRVTVEWETPQTGVAHQPCTLTVRAVNGSALPLPCICVWLRAENLLTGQTTAMTLPLSAPPRRAGERQVTLEDPLCGVYRLRVEKARVYDLLGLVGFALPAMERREFPVEPDLLELRLNLPLRTGVSDDSDSYSQERPGYDFADTFQLREYVPGDSAKQIHWKLSSKLNRLVVRDPGLPLERSVLLLWERRAEGEAPQQASAMAEMVISLARELLRQGVRCQAAWNDAAGQDCALYELEDETTLYDMLPKLLSAAASRGLESVAELYLRQYGRPSGKTVYISAGDCPALERLCDPAELVGLFCAAEAPRDFPGRSYCFDPAAEDALYEIDLY